MSEQPALRISNIVYGRQVVGNRVRYLIDPKGGGTETAVPETVVLKRWRRRQLDGYKFSGTRLSSTLWRAIHLAFCLDAKLICGLNINEIRQPKNENALYWRNSITNYQVQRDCTHSYLL